MNKPFILCKYIGSSLKLKNYAGLVSETAVKTVTGCSKFHQVVKVAPLIIKSRGLACFCFACWEGLFHECINRAYVGVFEVHQIQPLQVCHLKSFSWSHFIVSIFFFFIIIVYVLLHNLKTTSFAVKFAW